MTTTYDAIEAPTTPPTDSGELTGVTPELRALLTAYSQALDSVNNSRVFSRITPIDPALPRWLTFPALRYFVSAFFVRYLYRSVAALKSGAMRRGVLSDTADEENGDLELLEHFEESLPPRIRLALVLPIILMVVLSIAYLLAWYCHAGYRNLLGDLTTSVVTVNRTAVLTAFQNANRIAQLQHPQEASFFAGAAMIVAWSAVVAMLPLLPAFYVIRRKRARFADSEKRAFAALGARPVREIEINLIVRLLLIVAVALLGTIAGSQAVTDYRSSHSRDYVCAAFVVISVVLTILAVIELEICNREHRRRAAYRRGAATKIAFAMVAVLATGLFFSLPAWERKSNRENSFWPRKVSTQAPRFDDKDQARGWLTNQLSFIVTKINQNARCLEPHGFLIENPQQYLEFDLEVWSDVDQFANQATANALALPHWSVWDSRGKSTGRLFMHEKCGRGTDAIFKPIAAGTHSITSVVVSAPKDAMCLQLDVPSYRGVWKWAIPPAPEEACDSN